MATKTPSMLIFQYFPLLRKNYFFIFTINHFALYYELCNITDVFHPLRNTMKGGCRRAEKSCKLLMIIKAATLGQELEQGRSRAGQRAGPERTEAGQGRSRVEVGTGQE